MTLSWTQIFGLFQLTIRDPKEGAEAVLTLPLPRGAVPIIFILSVVFVALLSGVLQLVLPIPEEAQVTGPGPFTLAVLQCAQTAVLILAIQKVGQWLGGQGNLVETTLILSWLQIMVLPIQAVVLFFTIVAPLLG